VHDGDTQQILLQELRNAKAGCDKKTSNPAFLRLPEIIIFLFRLSNGSGTHDDDSSKRLAASPLVSVASCERRLQFAAANRSIVVRSMCFR
jgi:hypothetical protein